jgi:hypothetical protein
MFRAGTLRFRTEPGCKSGKTAQGNDSCRVQRR